MRVFGPRMRSFFMRMWMICSTLAVVTLVGGSANAQKQDDPRRGEAEKFYQEGMRLHDKAMHAEALQSYEEAYKIYPSPNVLLNLAVEEMLLGKNLKAMRHFREAMRNPLMAPSAADLAKQHIAKLEPSLARIDLKGPSGLVVSLGNGHESVRLPLPEPLDVEPGTIAAIGALDGQRYDGGAEAVAGKIVVIEMKAPFVATSSLPADSEHSDPMLRYWVSGSIATLGVVGLGLGIGYTVAANNAAKDVSNAKAADGGVSSCLGTTPAADCRSRQNKEDARVRNSNIAVGSYVAGGVLVAAGVASYFLWPYLTGGPGKESREPNQSASRQSAGAVPLVPWVGKDGAGLAYGKEF
jgi:hypothetical protein